MAKILIIDDEKNIRNSLKSALQRRGHEITTACSFAEGSKHLDTDYDLILLDIMLGDGNGLELLKQFLKKNRRHMVVMISGHADVDMAVGAIRAGAYDFIEKPISLDRVLVTIDNATRTSRLRAETGRLASLVYGEFIGQSPPVVQMKKDITRAAGKTSRFLILGENGTGKELVAHMIHRAGNRADGPFVEVNCAALPSELVESELFGHVKGAFTGASTARKGRFVEASGGSIFLDEISEMSLDAQAKILRAIESSQITPVGSDKSVTVDANIIAASNRNLEDMVTDQTFRQDLLYRLNVVQFQLPPLRERRDDIPLLASHFLKRFAHETGSITRTLSTAAINTLTAYDYPGNVRELKNLMERVNIYCDCQKIGPSDLKPLMPPVQENTVRPLKEAVTEFEQSYIENILQRNNGNMTESARQLGLERSHLYKKIKKYK